MYLIHLPLLVGFEILLVSLDWPIVIKLGPTWVVVGAVLVISFTCWSGPPDRPVAERATDPFRWPGRAG